MKRTKLQVTLSFQLRPAAFPWRFIVESVTQTPPTFLLFHGGHLNSCWSREWFNLTEIPLNYANVRSRPCSDTSAISSRHVVATIIYGAAFFKKRKQAPGHWLIAPPRNELSHAIYVLSPLFRSSLSRRSTSVTNTKGKMKLISGTFLLATDELNKRLFEFWIDWNFRDGLVYLFFSSFGPRNSRVLLTFKLIRCNVVICQIISFHSLASFFNN